MKALCNREGLLAALNMVSGVVPARSPKPILQGIKFVADQSGSIFVATDLEVGIRHRVLGVKCEKAGTTMLGLAKFSSILRTGRDLDLHLDKKGEQVVIKGEKSEFKLPTEDPDLFPDVPDFTAAAYHVVAAADLKKLIRRTMFATDTDSQRYALGGVLVELTPTSIAMIGTDGRRLALMTASAETEGNPPIPDSPVIPLKALKLIDRNLDDGDPPVHLAFDTRSATVRTERAVIHSRLVEGRFPPYRNIFPASHDVDLKLNAFDLRVAVEQASIVTSEESRGVDFSFHKGILRLSSQAADVGSSFVEMPLLYEGKKVEITFDPRYINDALKTLDDECEITVELTDSKNPAVFKTEDGYAYILQPIMRDEPIVNTKKAAAAATA